jgi:hypothetical protein
MVSIDFIKIGKNSTQSPLLFFILNSPNTFKIVLDPIPAIESFSIKPPKILKIDNTTSGNVWNIKYFSEFSL